MARVPVDYASLDEEWLGHLEESARAASLLLHKTDGTIRKTIDAGEVRAAAFLYELTEKRALIAQVRAKRAGDKETNVSLTRKLAKMKKERDKLKHRVQQLEAELKVMRVYAPESGDE